MKRKNPRTQETPYPFYKALPTRFLPLCIPFGAELRNTVDFASVKGEDLLQPPSLERTRPPRTARFLVALPHTVENGTGSRCKYANTLPQVLFPYIATRSASLDLRHHASEEPRQMTGGLGCPCPLLQSAGTSPGGGEQCVQSSPP